MRASDDIRPGDVVVAELAGAVDRATFMGDVTGLAIKTAGAVGVVIDGGLRDLTEFLPWKREMIASRKYHTKEIYPRLSLELEKLFEEWKKSRPRP